MTASLIQPVMTTSTKPRVPAHSEGAVLVVYECVYTANELQLHSDFGSNSDWAQWPAIRCGQLLE